MDTQSQPRKPYPTDVSDEEWAFVAPYLALVREDAPQRRHDLREVFNALRWAGVFEAMAHDLRMLLREAGDRMPQPRAVIFDSRTVQSTPESGAGAGYDGHKRRKGRKTHAAIDTLGHLLALILTPANAQDRAQVAALAEAVQEVTGEAVEVGFVDQGYTGEQAAAEAAAHGIRLEVVKLSEAKRGFVLLPRRWVVERSFAWVARFRRLARDYERLPATVVGLHFLAFACLLLHRLIPLLAESP